MICWRCGRGQKRIVVEPYVELIVAEIDHADWCSIPGGCHHCGWRPHRWWCMNGWNAAELASIAYAGHTSGPR